MDPDDTTERQVDDTTDDSRPTAQSNAETDADGRSVPDSTAVDANAGSERNRRTDGPNEATEPGEASETTENDDTSDGMRTAAAEEVDQRIVDLLSWILDTETRAKIYVHLLAHPASTSEEVAKGTGLYPSTVREALAELHDEERVTRQKRASEGAGNNPYEYTAIQPSDLVGGVVDQVQQELNTIFTLDRVLDRSADGNTDGSQTHGFDPVTITVDSDDTDIDTDAGEDTITGTESNTSTETDPDSSTTANTGTGTNTNTNTTVDDPAADADSTPDTDTTTSSSEATDTHDR
ncbi:TrmB family transcription regulator [Natrialba magadii ATCC 43099]|uniref:TrmB family transcription regulator n=1 Tax=Natrialba magadii (strain ATCC 43099 / DSM 3394 / CCM 3739 / CIP 104546 / IAM 13178 / JCM 8861 / NBRC 102185 / NCIMB 2190 / MS3) TaxID=547559 RepID=D3SZ89_NATMM|nr:helix-turn-helix domain-containing protein [Natrialba magadii]ADD04223.1 TrmB family transcription regulator [Natrialba magadii ATCC 43099]ELY26627.1 TrmB family transcriptional regulator [Natrialba magadii ATCC 43099]